MGDAKVLVESIGQFVASSQDISLIDAQLQEAQTHEYLENVMKQSIFDHVLSHYKDGNHLDHTQVERFLELLYFIADKKYVRMIRIFGFLEDIFEALSISDCEVWFSWCEQNRDRLKYLTGQMRSEECAFIVRTFQVILKRLDKTIDSILYGRILSFVAAVIPFSNPSGTIKRKETDPAYVFDIPEFVPDHPLYFALWDHLRSLQTLNIAQADPKIFQSLKDTFRDINKCISAIDKNDTQTFAYTDRSTGFFSKIIMNPQLFETQLKDPLFLYQILTYMYISLSLVKHVEEVEDTSNNKANETTKEESTATNNAAIINSIKMDLSNMIQKLPNGEKYMENLKEILRKEEIWSEWKEKKSAPFELKPIEPLKKRSVEEVTNDVDEWIGRLSPSNLLKRRKGTLREGFKDSVNQLRSQRDSQVDMGNENINQIWNCEPEKYHGVVDLKKLIDINDMPFGHDEVDMLEWMMRRSILKHHDLNVYHRVVVTPTDKEKEMYKKKFGLKAYRKLIISGVDTLEKYEQKVKEDKVEEDRLKEIAEKEAEQKAEALKIKEAEELKIREEQKRKEEEQKREEEEKLKFKEEEEKKRLEELKELEALEEDESSMQMDEDKEDKRHDGKEEHKEDEKKDNKDDEDYSAHKEEDDDEEYEL